MYAPNTMDDLAKRLRALALRSNDGYLCTPALEAADAIEALQAQIARLTAERDAAYERAAEVSESFDGFQIGAVTWPGRIAAAIRALKDAPPK